MQTIDQKLETLYELLIADYSTLETELKDLISHPEKIENTNKFASLLSDLKKTEYINPLLQKISLSNKGDVWLTDFLYAAINLLDDSSDENEFYPPKIIIDKLQIWILENKGELAWKSASLLKFYESEAAERIQLIKLEERGDFFLTYAECILGLLRYNKEKHKALIQNIADDKTRDEKLRKFAEDVMKNYW